MTDIDPDEIIKEPPKWQVLVEAAVNLGNSGAKFLARNLADNTTTLWRVSKDEWPQDKERTPENMREMICKAFMERGMTLRTLTVIVSGRVDVRTGTIVTSFLLGENFNNCPFRDVMKTALPRAKDVFLINDTVCSATSAYLTIMASGKGQFPALVVDCGTGLSLAVVAALTCSRVAIRNCDAGWVNMRLPPALSWEDEIWKRGGNDALASLGAAAWSEAVAQSVNCVLERLGTEKWRDDKPCPPIATIIFVGGNSTALDESVLRASLRLPNEAILEGCGGTRDEKLRQHLHAGLAYASMAHLCDVREFGEK